MDKSLILIENDFDLLIIVCLSIFSFYDDVKAMTAFTPVQG